MPVSTLPNIPEFKSVFLEILSDGEAHKLRDIADKIAVHFSLTPEQLNEKVPCGDNRFHTRVSLYFTNSQRRRFDNQAQVGLLPT